MGWFWADSENSAKTIANDGAKCPVKHSSSEAKCPVKHKPEIPAVCPMKKNGSNDLNPLNNMPQFISADKLPGQKLDLPTDRTFSSIPRGEDESEGVWEYPSPQQMFNAMVRKGKAEDIPEDAVESMVDVHNFLNEGAWEEILEWEQPYTDETKKVPRLAQFTGRPDDLSPRARIYLQLSKVFPETFSPEPPFDRHDWFVLRANQNGGWDKVRYVIDYYGGPDDVHGMPTFFLDVRPALDNFSNARDRLRHWLKPYWDVTLQNSSSIAGETPSSSRPPAK